MAQIDEIRKDREATLAKVRELGWDPYASKYEKKHTVAEAISMDGQEVQTAGRIVSSRTHGNIVFMDLRDSSGKIQLFFQKDVLSDDAFKNLKYIDVGDHIGVTGKVMYTTAGEISIQPTSYILLAKSLFPIPGELKDIETRYRKRYLDLLVNENVKDVFAMRTHVVTLLRQFLNDHNFHEVETPVLQPLYGGTTAKPFTTHHNALDADFYLRIAVELYLKRLMVGGYERVYEIGKNFRNEGFSRQHNPEFTMLEFYWAYADYNSLMDFTEEMLSSIVKKIKGTYAVTFEGQEYDFTPGWERKTFRQLYIEHLDIDLDEYNSEEKLAQIVKERNLLDEKVIGYAMLMDEVYKKHIRPKLKGPMFVTDHPVELMVLAKRNPQDPTKASSFQLLVNGAEFLTSYNELNDPIDQKQRWLDDMKEGEHGAEEFQILDEDYVEALSYGMPPTAGWGLGVDRFTAFLADQHAIKDVILFPTMKPEGDTHQIVMAPHVESEPAKPVPQSSKKAELTLTKEAALTILNDHLTTKNLISHCLAVGATMRALAARLGGDPDLWELAGMLHDADWDETRETPDLHTAKTIDWIKGAGENNQELIDTILSHNHHHNGFRGPESAMEWALYTCDELTGFIVAVALIKPDKKLATVEVKSVLKRFPVTGFAKPVDREQIKLCEEKLGIPLEEFVGITLQAMQGIAEEIGL